MRKRIVSSVVTFCGLVGAAGQCSAELKLPHILSDHAVLQREAPIRVWGWSEPGEQVQASFHGQTVQTTADTLGKWALALAPEHAGGPYTLTLTGSKTAQPVVLNDLLVGDVWFASGQSNMQFPLQGFGADTPLKNQAEEIARSGTDGVRLLRWETKSSSYPLDDREGAWTLCTPETAKNFSAVAFFFGREIHEREHVPVGLIDSSWGGTPIEAWISMDALAGELSTLPSLAWWARMEDTEADTPLLRARDKRDDDQATAAGQPKPKHPWHPDPGSWAPAQLFNGMVSAATRYSIKGVLWYQGETDSGEDRAPLYEKLLPAMIGDWRQKWAEGNIPFLFVQISSFTSTPSETWGIVREAERRALGVAGTAMVVTTDIGQADNVHPADKQTVGARLALAARATVYGEKVEFSGPIFREATPDGAGLRVWFDHGEGLRAKAGALQGFELAGEDGRFHAAEAKAERLGGQDTVLVQAAGVAEPRWVRYAWENAPLAANLVNAAGLPASTFTSQEAMPKPCPISLHASCP